MLRAMHGLLAAASGLVLLSAGAASADCLKAGGEDQVVQGRLAFGRFQDANLKWEQAYILRLRAPICLDGDNAYDKIDKTDRVHVFSMDQAVRRRLRTLIGKQVRARGQPFGQHTAHHHAPIVMQIKTIDPI